MLPRLGQVSFINCLPIYLGLDTTVATILKGVPTALNEALARGEIDVGSVSSIEYAWHQDQYVLLPSLSVSARGRVGSVGLFSLKPLEALEGEPICLPDTSATSVALLQVLLRHHWRVQARFITAPADLSVMFSQAAAGLLIGDACLRARAKPLGCSYYDLGEAWWELTGERMVYALFVLRREFYERYPQETRGLIRGLKEAKAWGKANLGEVIREARAQVDVSLSLLEEYFAQQEYDFDASYQRGLLRFYALAEELGLCPKVERLEIIETEADAVGP